MGQHKVQEEHVVTLHSLCICRLTLACISSEISTKLLGMPTHPSLLPSTDRCRLRTATLRLPSLTAFSESLFPTPHWPAFPCPLPVASRSWAQALVWFRAKTNNKIVCLVPPFIVSHIYIYTSVCIYLYICLHIRIHVGMFIYM